MKQLHNSKNLAKKRRAARTRYANIAQANRHDKESRPVIVVNKTNQHIYAQLISFEDHKSKVLSSASTVEKGIDLKGNKSDKAREIGKLLAKRAKKEHSIVKVAYDRNGYKYHGRVKALAEGAREEGMDF